MNRSTRSGVFEMEAVPARARLRQAFAGNPDIVNRLGQARSVFLSTVVLGELFYGAQNSSRADQNLIRLRGFAKSVSILSCDLETAEHYGRIKHQLRIIGRPIPENDLWIAAAVQQHQLILATSDRHFEAITGLAVESW